METLAIILLFTAFSLLVAAIFISIRNEKVHGYFNALIELASRYEDKRIKDGIGFLENGEGAYSWFVGKHSYSRLLFSFKKLTLSNWFTEEEITKILS